MKNVISLFFSLMCVVTLLKSQGDYWILSMHYGLQAHDKRLYDFPPREGVLARQPEIFGTHQIGIQLQKKITHKGKFSLYFGAGISTEVATFERPFDHSYKKSTAVTRDLRWTNRYYQLVFQLPLNGNYYISDKFGLALDLLPQFNFLTIAGNTTVSVDNYKLWRFDPYSLEVNPGVSYTHSRLSFRVSCRAFQLKNIDEIIFNNILRYEPKEGQIHETFNPFKVWLSVGYYIQNKGVK